MSSNKRIDINDTLATRSFVVSDFRASEDEYNIEGHAAVFNQEVNIGGWFKEVIERGAFDECDLSDVSLFVNHITNKIPLARSRNNSNESTMNIEVDDRGLFIRAKLDTENNQESKMLHSSISRGDIDGMSFSFRIKEQTWEGLDTKLPTRRIKKIAKVFEVSAVNNPAYSETDISARDKEDLENEKNNIEKRSNNNECELLKLKFLGGLY